jgi:hypothetical protein
MKVVLSYYNMFEVANIRKPDYTFNCNLTDSRREISRKNSDVVCQEIGRLSMPV